jgi:hypothetical protein
VLLPGCFFPFSASLTGFGSLTGMILMEKSQSAGEVQQIHRLNRKHNWKVSVPWHSWPVSQELRVQLQRVNF